MHKLPITSVDLKPANGSAAQRSLRETAAVVAKPRGYWRSIDQLQETPEFQQHVEREFPQAASEFPDGISRRRWMKLMSASFALGGLAGCQYGPEQIAAFVVRPPNTIPGVPKHYATNFELAGRAVHLLVSNVDGRPIKIEGNAQHPLMRATEPNEISNGKERFASAGTDVFSQACILELYDPDRCSAVFKRGEANPLTWEAFAAYAQQHSEVLSRNQGDSLAIIMSPSLSPSVNRMVGELLKRYPQATLVQHSSLDRSAQQAACRQVAGQPAELLYKMDAAMVICCLDSDPLGNDPNMVINSRGFAKGREPATGAMNRLYSVESRFSVTGTSADARLPLRSSQIGAFVVRLEQAVDALLAGGSAVAAVEGEKAFDEISSTEQLSRFVDAVAEDLVKHQGAGLISVGYHQPLEVQLAALRLNQKLGNLGKTVLLMPERSVVPGAQPVGLDSLVRQLGAKIDTVWILGDNPVYTAPGDVKLAAELEKLQHVVYFANYVDETATASAWAVPLAHPLESWGDVLGADGSYGICQPQILPLLGGRSAIEILSLLAGAPESGEAIVRRTAEGLKSSLTSREWREALHSGFLGGFASEPLEAGGATEGPAPAGAIDRDTIENGQLELLIVESDAVYDGRFAKNVWLQELPQAVTKLTWDNAALVSFDTAKRLGLAQGDKARIKHKGRQIELPVYLVPGIAAGSIVTFLGYGRRCRDEVVLSDEEMVVGFNVNPLRTSSEMHLLTGVEVGNTAVPYKLATTQDHFALDETGLWGIEERVGRIVREGTLEQIVEGGHDFVEHQGMHHPPLESLWEEPMQVLRNDPTVPNQWGMTVDLNKCTGCNACVIACQSENNVPVVGKEQVSRGREMHWLRLDRYFRGDHSGPQIVNQPMACVHCETAPCEQVCPVAATVHTEDGINAMAYNRCIGTRYCANNCPYKVRRFNYFNYNAEYGYFYGWQQKGRLEEASRKLQQLVLNPEVTVRGRGVMEKCTYCIQRVQNGKIRARNDGRPVLDGEIQTACQTACPTQAIVFGDLKDPESKVTKLMYSPRSYAVLSELNVKPRTQYLARVRNTHPRLLLSHQLAASHHGDHGGGHGHDHAHGDDHGHGDEHH
jgi:MoCo/4Fe-4S cofactor protein with predicted Tat translocation signal